MNKLPIAKKAQIINLLVEGSSMRATSRIADVSINTVTKLLVDVGRACEKFHDETVKFVQTKRIQCDEIWSFVYAKDKHATPQLKEDKRAGDIWTWTAIDAESKLIISWYVGDRTLTSAEAFMGDVARRLSNRVQLTTDGYKTYLEAVERVFGDIGIDYAQLHKMYGQAEVGKYSPAERIGTKKVNVTGQPEKKPISTSFVERQNLTVRMHMRRFTRLTDAFSKKIENHCLVIALHFVYYNFVQIHKSLRVTPAMEAGLAKKPMTMEDIVNLTP